MDADIGAALARIDAPEASLRERRFPLGLRVQRLKDALKRREARAARRLIRAANADLLLAELPQEPGESTHAILPGDFVFCDLLSRLIARLGCPERIHITTLSMSEANVQSLLGILHHPVRPHITLLVSYYFQSTNRDIFRTIQTLLVPHPGFRLAIGRQHTKVILMDYPRQPEGPGPLVIEGSANLRSSNSLEQVAIFSSSELLQFHRDWIEEFYRLCSTGDYEQMVAF